MGEEVDVRREEEGVGRGERVGVGVVIVVDTVEEKWRNCGCGGCAGGGGGEVYGWGR